MVRNLLILSVAAVVIALPFLFQQKAETEQWQPSDPTVVIITPMNDAIRYEFGRAFSRWHRDRHGSPVRIEWRDVGGTSEIARYLTAEYVTAFRAWYTRQGNPWPAGASEVVVRTRFDTETPPTTTRRENESESAFQARAEAERLKWEQLCNVYKTFREIDDPAAFTTRIDILFGGGAYDHKKAFRQGLTVAPWPPEEAPTTLWESADGEIEFIPRDIAGSTWRTDTQFGCAVSTFGICYNLDRIADLGMKSPPTQWDDLANPVFFRNLGVADPTKSGSVAKAFELMVHQKCYQAVRAAGFDNDAIASMEGVLDEAEWNGGPLPEGVPQEYQAAIEAGWLDGVRLMQRIGANARYFTDTSTKIPVDVSMGNAAAGLAIDFYGRYQMQTSRLPDGRDVMGFTTPTGGSGADADPISLLRGAEHREIAARFIEFVLTEEGQQLWTYKPGSPGGPEKFALRRVPIRRDFFPSDNSQVQAAHERHLEHSVDDLSLPSINPYAIAEQFVYHPRWTARHFGVHRDLIRAMCIDSSTELKAAWEAILETGGPEANPEAIRAMQELPSRPEPLNWRTAPNIVRSHDRLDYMREWTGSFRENYRRAKRLAESNSR